MKKFFPLLLCFLSYSNLNSQDRVILQNGDTVFCIISSANGDVFSFQNYKGEKSKVPANLVKSYLFDYTFTDLLIDNNGDSLFCRITAINNQWIDFYKLPDEKSITPLHMQISKRKIKKGILQQRENFLRSSILTDELLKISSKPLPETHFQKAANKIMTATFVNIAGAFIIAFGLYTANPLFVYAGLAIMPAGFTFSILSFSHLKKAGVFSD